MTTARRKIAFVTDSTCDLSPEFTQAHDIGVVPCFVNYGGRGYVDDGVDLVRETFYQQFAGIRPYPTSAAPSPGMTESALHKAAASADHVIILTPPAKLSGIYNVQRLAAATLPPDRVTLIDAGTTTMALGYQVQVGVETAEATGDLTATLNAIQAARENVNMYAALNTLDYLRAGGRVSWLTAGIGGLFKIKPIIDMKDGIVHSVSRQRTFSRALDELASLARAMAPLERLSIIHTNSAELVPSLLDRMSDIVPEDLRILSVTPTLGLHVGPDAVGVVPLSKSWRR